MGNNATMTAFEATVIAVYDQGVLTVDLLDALAKPYRDSDIDLGGLRELETKDGKGLLQVIAETINPGVVPPLDPDYPEEGPCWYEAYRDIVRSRWNFW